MPGALDECARVIKPGGSVVVIDVLAPERALLDTALQSLELLRDESHVRDYRESEWRAMLVAARFSAPSVARWRLPMEFQSWVARIGTSLPRITALETPDRSFSIDAGWLEAVKSSS